MTNTIKNYINFKLGLINAGQYAILKRENQFQTFLKLHGIH